MAIWRSVEDTWRQLQCGDEVQLNSGGVCGGGRREV
jgi:hypothetical protein